MSEIIKKKKENSRKYPGAKGRRPDNKKFRQQEALERQAEHDKLTVEQKLQKLDNRLGKNVGAKKERQQLINFLGQNNSVPIAEPQETKLPAQTIAELQEINQVSENKKIKAKDRRKSEQNRS